MLRLFQKPFVLINLGPVSALLYHIVSGDVSLWWKNVSNPMNEMDCVVIGRMMFLGTISEAVWEKDLI